MDKTELFHSLHKSDELLLLGNAWDLPSARMLEQAGFRAVGTTSWGIAASLGYGDGEELDFDLQLSTIKRIVDHVGIPVTADIESGYGEDDETVILNVLKVAHLGAVGINLEDSLKGEKGLKTISDQAHLLAGIRAALESAGFGNFFINARTDPYLLLEDPLGETLARAKAYAEHGASGIFVPGIKAEEDIRAVVSCTPAPLNVMALPGLTDGRRLQEWGVRRLSLGGSLYRKMFRQLERVAAEMTDSRNVSILFE